MATRLGDGWPEDMCDLRAAEIAAAGQGRKAAQGGEDNHDPEDECE